MIAYRTLDPHGSPLLTALLDLIIVESIAIK